MWSRAGGAAATGACARVRTTSPGHPRRARHGACATASPADRAEQHRIKSANMRKEIAAALRGARVRRGERCRVVTPTTYLKNVQQVVANLARLAACARRERGRHSRQQLIFTASQCDQEWAMVDGDHGAGAGVDVDLRAANSTHTSGHVRSRANRRRRSWHRPARAHRHARIAMHW